MLLHKSSFVDDTDSFAGLVYHEAVFADSCEYKRLVTYHFVGEIGFDKFFELLSVTREHHLSDSLESQIDRSVNF